MPTVAVWLVPLVALLAPGLIAGFAAGLFGIGGGGVALLAVLPLLGGSRAELAHVAIGTSAATIILTSLPSVVAHARRHAVEFEAPHRAAMSSIKTRGWVPHGADCPAPPVQLSSPCHAAAT